MRAFAIVPLAFAAAVGLAPADDPPKLPIAAKVVKMDLPHSKLKVVVAELTRQSGLAVTFPEKAADEPCDGIFQGKPFWDALEQLADQTGNRIVLHDHGRELALEPRGKSKEISSVAGPFRVVARQVVGRNFLDTGLVFHEVQLDVHWEPRFPVFRIDSRPKVATATDDRGVALTAQPTAGRSQLSGVAVHESSVRLSGLTRDSRKIAVLAGEFTVTAANKMLAFKWTDLTARTPPAVPPQEGVSVVLKRFEKDEKVWEAEVEVTNPPGGPVFESFESWTGENQLRLVSPDAAKSFTPDDYEIRAGERKLVAVYRFKEDPAKGLVGVNGKGWSLLYTTPAPMSDFKVHFELRDIPLP